MLSLIKNKVNDYKIKNGGKTTENEKYEIVKIMAKNRREGPPSQRKRCQKAQKTVKNRQK